MIATDGCLFRARGFKGQAELSARPSTVPAQRHCEFRAPRQKRRAHGKPAVRFPGKRQFDSETFYCYNLPMESDRLTLRELSHRSNVTARTVHFYIQQGLLPPAGSPGPGAKYDEGHLARLRLIRRLQREHLPLAEIRKRLEAMDDEAIRMAVAESAAEEHPEPASALDYVRRLLARDQRGEATRLDRVALNAVTPAARPVTQVVAAESARLSLGALASPIEALPPEPAAQAPAVRPSVAERSQWERYALAPDIELHVRRPLSRDQNRRVERLLARAHNIFNEELS